jgi:hypothetical protein
MRPLRFDPPIPPSLINQFKSAGDGLVGPYVGEAIITAIVAYFKAEVTVLSKEFNSEIFRVGYGDGPPGTKYPHGIKGVHIHEGTFNLHAPAGVRKYSVQKDAIAFLTCPEGELYLNDLLEALARGEYRSGFDR